MKEKIINLIIQNKVVTLDDLESRAEKRGMSLDDLYQTLELVHKDKRIKKSVTQGSITYYYQPPKVRQPGSHLTWLRENYPWPENFIMPFPQWSLAWMFLSPDEMVEYKECLNPSLKFKRKLSST